MNERERKKKALIIYKQSKAENVRRRLLFNMVCMYESIHPFIISK